MTNPYVFPDQMPAEDGALWSDYVPMDERVLEIQLPLEQMCVFT